jgi:hypothetical protein
MQLLIKIQEPDIIDDMYSNEYLYFSYLNIFKEKDEENNGRKDPRELIVKTEQIKNVSVEIDEKTFHFNQVFKEYNGRYNIHLKDSVINCCSLYLLELNVGESKNEIDQKILELGGKMLIIYDVARFFEILDENLEKLNYQYSRKKVSYYNSKEYNGALTLHQKDNQLEYQNEYRILIAPTNKQGIKIPLPGLKNVSITRHSSDIFKLRIEPENKLV